MSKTIFIKPVEMTKEVMESLEQKGLITRIVSGAFSKDPGDDPFCDVVIHSSDIKSGAHEFCSACNNREQVDELLAHSDHEEVFFIGPEDAKPLYLIFSFLSLEAFNKKVQEGTLSDEDFITLRVKFNDLEVSLFTIRKGVVHVEFVQPGSNAAPPSFFFSSGNSLTHERVCFGDYKFDVSKFLG